MTDQRPLRVAFVAHSAGRGGADLLLSELVIALTESGLCACLVVAPSGGDLTDELRDAGVPVAVAEYEWWCSQRQEDRRPATLAGKRVLHVARTLWPSTTSIITAIGDFSPDVVASNTCVSPAGALAAARMRAPHVWLAQEFGRADYGFTFFLGYGLSMRLLGASSQVVVAISGSLGRALEQYVTPRKIHVLHAASVTPPGSPLAPRAAGEPLQLILILGSALGTKGIEEAIRAVAIARSRGVDVRLRLVGGHDEPACRRLAAAAGVREAVTVAGRVEAVVPEIDHAHVGLMCSRSEAFGRVTVEYLRRGRPVIGTRAGGTPELVEDGVTGLLYDPGDSEALADRIEWLASSDTTLTELSRSALEHNTDRFMLSDYLPAFSSCLDRARDAGPVLARTRDPRGDRPARPRVTLS